MLFSNGQYEALLSYEGSFYVTMDGPTGRFLACLPYLRDAMNLIRLWLALPTIANVMLYKQTK